MSTFVLHDEELGLVAVEYPRARRGRKGEVSFRRSRVSGSRIAAHFKFRTSERYPGFREVAGDGRPTVTNVVTSDSGRVFGYAYSDSFLDDKSGEIYPSGRYLAQLLTVELLCESQTGVVTISYELEPVRQNGRFRYAGQYRHKPRAVCSVLEAQHRLAV